MQTPTHGMTATALFLKKAHCPPALLYGTAWGRPCLPRDPLPSHQSQFIPGSAPPAGTPTPPQAAPGGQHGDRPAACRVPFRGGIRCPGAGRACGSGRKAVGAGGVGEHFLGYFSACEVPVPLSPAGWPLGPRRSLHLADISASTFQGLLLTESPSPTNRSSGHVPEGAQRTWPVSLVSCAHVSPVPSRRDRPHEEAALPSSCPPGRWPRAGVSRGERLRSGPGDHPSPPPHVLEAARVPASQVRALRLTGLQPLPELHLPGLRLPPAGTETSAPQRGGGQGTGLRTSQTALHPGSWEPPSSRPTCRAPGVRVPRGCHGWRSRGRATARARAP